MLHHHSRGRRRLRFGAALTALAVGLTGVLAPSAGAKLPLANPPARDKPTIVLVHGAWADTSSWDAVIRHLFRDGYQVSAFATPLQSLAGDSAALRAYLESIAGPIVLVGHSYGGAVISDAATGDRNVKELVYLDAFAPDQGQPVIALAGPDSALNTPGVLMPIPAGPPTPASELYIDAGAFAQAFANDLPAARAKILAATQRPVTFGALTEPSSAPAWKTIPSWYEVGTIARVIPPSAQLSMATHIGAHVVKARTGHLPMISAPGVVTSLIERAADDTP